VPADESDGTRAMEPGPFGVEIGRALRPNSKVLPGRARAHNRSLVLQTLYRGSGLSRADLARKTGLTRVTISDLVAELIRDGLVLETGHRDEARPGKPAVLLEVNRSWAQIIGVDLSEDRTFRGAVLSLDGAVEERAEVDLEGATGPEALTKALALIDELRAVATRRVLGIGIGSPGVVDPAGVVDAAPNLGWSQLALQRAVAEHTGLHAYAANDANVAVLAEHGYGPAEGDMILVKLGHGVGAGLIVGGSLVWGSRYAAGEIGQVATRDAAGEQPGGEPHPRALESVISVPQLNARLASGADREELLEDAGVRLGEVLAPIVGALNLAEVVLSGPEDLVQGAFMSATLRTLQRRTMSGFHTGVTVRMTRLGRDIVVRGAAVMVLSRELGVS